MKRIVLTASVLTLAAASGLPAMAQQAWKAPHNSFGQPDLMGTWNSGSLTNLERSPQYKDLIVPDDQAERRAT